MHAHDDIRIGTLVPVHDRTAEVVEQLLPQGFETFQLSFAHRIGDVDLERLAERLRETLAAFPASDGIPRSISALGLYGNPLTSPEAVTDWERTRADIYTIADGYESWAAAVEGQGGRANKKAAGKLRDKAKKLLSGKR